MSDVALSMPQEHRAAVIQLGAELFQGLKVIDAEIDAFVRAPGQRQAMHEDVATLRSLVVILDEVLSQQIRAEVIA